MHRLVAPPILRARTRAVEVRREELVRAAQVSGEVEQLGVVAELLEDVDRLERLRLRPAQERLDLWRGDKQPVERELEVGEAAEDDLFVLDGDW